jgi:glycosyltransferase involved in cell wall biosynthesis
MRLLWLIDSLNVGGAESLVVPFATRAEDITVAYLRATGENLVEQELRRRGVRTVNLGARNLRDRAAFRRLVDLVRDERLELVHAHLSYSAIWSALLSRRTGIPSVVSLHASPAATKSLDPSFVNALKVEMKDRLMRFVVNRWSRRVVMVSAALRDTYARGFDREKVHVVHNGIEVERFRRDRAETRARLEREHDIPPGVRLAVTVSVLRPGKGIEVLLDAVERVPDAYFLIVGDGPKRAEWQALTKSDRVRWAGYRTDVDTILAGCDVFVHPSLDDAFPTVLLEAMAAGLPVVASRVGGIPEIVVGAPAAAGTAAFPTGILVPAGDAEALANAIFTANPSMGIAARERAEREFSIEAWIARLEHVYAEAARVKIVYLEPAGKGGMIHYAYQLCRALAACGADVTLITATNYELGALDAPFRVEKTIELWDPKPAGELSTSWWRVAGRRLRRVTRAIRYYRQWLRQIRRVEQLQPDVVLIGDIRFPFDLIPLALLRRKAKTLADICHNVHPFNPAGLFDRSPVQRFFYRRIYRLFDAVFVHFERNRRELLESFGVDESRVGVIAHGNEEIFRELRTPGVTATSLRKRIGIGDEPVVLFFGTLSRYKGIDVLIDAFPRVHRETGARLIIAGFPLADFDLDAHKDRVGASVTWVPEYIDSGDVAAWMELASVIVFPYRAVYQSGAVHVAQTFGVPTVASAVGAFQDVIEHEVSGLLVPPQDPRALADALVRLLRDPALAARLGARAMQDAQGPFAWTTIARMIVDAF